MVQPVPIPSFRFRVEIVEVGPRGGSGRAIDVDVSEIRLPAFRRRRDTASASAEVGPGPVRDELSEHLVLRRGHTGSTEFYDWWEDEQQSRKPTRRNVVVTVLDESRKPFTSWVFRECRMESFRYSPLDALESTLLMETAEISFKQAEQKRNAR